MTGGSTLVVLIGNSQSGPFGDLIWKARHVMVLIEKFDHLWIPSPVGFSAGQAMDQAPLKLSVEFTVAQELVVLIAGFVIADSKFKQLLIDNGIAEQQGDTEIRLIPPIATTFLENFQRIVDSALEIVRTQVRLGIVLLETESALQFQGIDWLRSKGIEIEIFSAEK